MMDDEKAYERREKGDSRCRCVTTLYGGVKRCRAHATDARGWCVRHGHYNGANDTPLWPRGVAS